MQTSQKLAMVFLLIGALALPAAIPFANAQLTVPGKVIITSAPPTTCGIDVNPPGSGLTFGSLASQQVSPEQTLSLVNTGTSGAVVDVKGDAWADADKVVHMSVEATHYGLTKGNQYDSMNALKSTASSFGQIAAGSSLDSYWLLKATLSKPDFSGALNQAITFTSFC